MVSGFCFVNSIPYFCFISPFLNIGLRLSGLVILAKSSVLGDVQYEPKRQLFPRGRAAPWLRRTPVLMHTAAARQLARRLALQYRSPRWIHRSRGDTTAGCALSCGVVAHRWHRHCQDWVLDHEAHHWEWLPHLDTPSDWPSLVL